MPVTPTYPGLYIEEIPSNAHTITAAPTSITVFVGYTHPFKTNTPGKAVRIFNFTDYEREFGGLYASDLLDSNVPYAVNQFFLNGGSDAYVVGLTPKFYDNAGGVLGNFDPPSITLGNNLVLTAREPADATHRLTVTLTNPKNIPADTADFTIAYGSRSETYRNVTIAGPVTAPNHINNRIGTSDKPVSGLVTVAPGGGAVFNTPIIQAGQVNIPQVLAITPPAGFFTTFKASDFTDVFQADTSLDKVPIFNLLAVPGVADNAIWSAAVAFCEDKQAFLIMDPPRQDSADGSDGLPKIEDDMLAGTLVPISTNGAFYFPYLKSQDTLTGLTRELPPSGYVAGIFARTDLNRGVWKAPAGLETTVLNTTGVVERGRMTDKRQGILNPLGVNCLRTFPGVGTVVFGARTLATQTVEQYRYVPVRRMALFLEQTLLRNLNWVVFEPNDEPLWVAIRTSIENFMLSLFNQGAFQGETPSQAFQVKCDSSTTTQTDIDNGIVNIVVAFRPLKPAEFVIIKIAQLAGQVQA